ncbi:MAG: riboflavin biosynthesis protein RibF [Eggerthellaceae bacterium]|nr:riboflavin biosynthesis protein RibF [Eggerthellaceae bacterium]
MSATRLSRIAYLQRGCHVAETLSFDEAKKLHTLKGASVAFGVFDGVHLGHKFLIECAAEAAVASDVSLVVLTFDKDPDELLRPLKVKKLLSNEERLDAIAACGVDAIVVLPFTQSLAKMNPHDFMEYAFGKNTPSLLHVGYDFTFGYKAEGTLKDLEDWGRSKRMEVLGHQLKSRDQIPISATRIRRLLQAGKVSAAANLLGYPYSITGKVIRGRGDGAEFGFRTANINIDDEYKCIADGVYGGYVDVDGKTYKAAVSVGVSPMFVSTATSNCEAHLIDFEGDIYGKNITIRFETYLRPMMRFSNTEYLVKMVNDNIAWINDNL